MADQQPQVLFQVLYPSKTIVFSVFLAPGTVLPLLTGPSEFFDKIFTLYQAVRQTLALADKMTQEGETAETVSAFFEKQAREHEVRRMLGEFN